MRQYRTEPRVPCDVPADVSYEIGAGYTRNVKATIRDTSKSGMGIVVANPFPVGATIKIIRAAKTATATVRHCIKRGAQHFVGVRLLP